MDASIANSIFSATNTQTFKTPAAPKFFEAAANFLGLSKHDLRLQLHQGKSLEDIAKAQGKSADALQKAMLAALQPEQQTKFSQKVAELIHSKGGFGGHRDARGATVSTVTDIVKLLTAQISNTPGAVNSLFDFSANNSKNANGTNGTAQTPADFALNLLA